MDGTLHHFLKILMWWTPSGWWGPYQFFFKLTDFDLLRIEIDSEMRTIYTVFPRIVSAETILFWKLKCGNYSREETIQRRKLLFSYISVRIHNLNSCRMLHTYALYLTNKVQLGK